MAILTKCHRHYLFVEGEIGIGNRIPEECTIHDNYFRPPAGRGMVKFSMCCMDNFDGHCIVGKISHRNNLYMKQKRMKNKTMFYRKELMSSLSDEVDFQTEFTR